METSIIQCLNVCKRYGNTPVLKGVDLEIPKNSVVGLLGKNGAGKTTLIKLMLGLLKISSGEIYVFGEEPWLLSNETKARIGYVPQRDRLYPWLTVEQLISYTGSFYPHWNQSLADQLLAQWQIDPKARMGVLSEGQAQKVAIILALGHEPDLLILDEPVASLDPLGRRQFLKTVLERVTDRGCTVFFSTHITSDLERVADRVAILNEGRVVSCGAMDDLKDGVKRLRLIGATPQPQDIPVGNLIHYETDHGDALITIKEFRPETCVRLGEQFNVEVRVEDLNLEEIFLEMSR